MSEAGNGSRRWLVSLFGDTTRSGRWDTGNQAVGVTLFGDTTLDVRDVDRDEVDLVAVSIWGDLNVVVPANARVDAGGFAVFGDMNDEVGAASGDDGMQVRVRRFSIFGDLNLRTD